MAMGLDDLNNDLQQEAGATPPTANAGATPPTVTAQDTLLEGKPHELQVKIMKAMSARKLDQDDPILEVYNCTGMAAEAATAAGQAAKAVQAGVASIHDHIYQGAAKAGDEIKSNLIHGIRAQGVEVGQALKMLIDSAANKGAADLKSAAGELDIKLGKIPAEVQKSLDDYKKNGVAEFAKAAQVAGQAAAQASLVAQISRSAMVSVVAFLFAVMVGAGGLWGWLLLTHQVMPAGVVAMADPLRGGDLLIVPKGGTVVPPDQCPGGICLIYKQGSIPSIP